MSNSSSNSSSNTPENAAAKSASSKFTLSKLVRRLRSTRDPNFIGFGKYRDVGGYHWKKLETNNDYKQRVDALKPFVVSDGSCLDLGCGDGAYAYELSSLCREVCGVDADYDAIVIARKNLAERSVGNVRCFQMPLSKVKPGVLRESSLFDFVYSMDVIEHLPEPAELLEVAARMTKPNGRIAIGTPLFISQELVSAYHIKEYSQLEMRELLGKHLKIEQEITLPFRRSDRKIYDNNYYLAIGTPLDKTATSQETR